MSALAACALRRAPAAPRFYPDDPLWVDDDTALDASTVVAVEDANSYDFVVNTFATPGERRNVRALNVNTLDEVPDSSWFTNRIGRTRLSLAEIARGPDRVDDVSLDGWVVVGRQVHRRAARIPHDAIRRASSIRSSSIRRRIPRWRPAPRSSARRSITRSATTRSTSISPSSIPSELVISREGARFRPARSATQAPLDAPRHRQRAAPRRARQPNGKYRVLASRFADGKPLGNFRYYGTRPDDPNDIVPHEHRRELRAARVFGAWLNHDDSRGVNSLDMLVAADGRALREALHVRLRVDHGQRHGLRAAPSRRQRVHPRVEAGLADAGDARALHAAVDAHRLSATCPPSVGRFEGDAFDPRAWKPEYPNPAFENMRPDDAFWAARIVSRFDDDGDPRHRREGAVLSDPRATDYLTDDADQAPRQGADARG